MELTLGSLFLVEHKVEPGCNTIFEIASTLEGRFRPEGDVFRRPQLSRSFTKEFGRVRMPRIAQLP
jgi:hypothetical protein